MAAPVDKSFISRHVQHGDYYFLNLDPNPGVALAVACGGREVCGENYVIDRPGFHFHSIELIAAGQAQVSIEGATFTLHAGSLFRYGPGVPHRISVEPGKQAVKYFVDFVGTEIEGLWGEVWPKLEPRRVAEPQRAQSLFDELARVGGGAKPNASRVCSLLVEQLARQVADDQVHDDAPNSAAWSCYAKCRGYIAESYLQLSHVAELARACHVSEAYISRVFRQYDSVSPYQLIQRYKMAHAASLLFDPRLLVKQVASMVGFDDQYHFSKAFKRAYGVSPREFRQHPRAGSGAKVRPAES